MFSPILFPPILFILALHSLRVTDARANEKKPCLSVSTEGGKPCLPICDTTKVNYTAIPKVHFANASIDSEKNHEDPKKRFHFFEWDLCPGSQGYNLPPMNESNENVHYRVLRNGSLFLIEYPGKDQIQSHRKYCLSLENNGTTYIPRFCGDTEADNTQSTLKLTKDKYIIYLEICGLVTVPFLLATIWVYSVLPELDNTYGKTLRYYLSCMVAFIIFYAARQISDYDYKAGGFCLFFGYTVYFLTLANFSWLNVMCFNMWWMFGGFGGLRSNATQRSRRNFIYYLIYGWGLPTFLTTICVIMEFTPGTKGLALHPNFREAACWFATTRSLALYILGPIAVIIASNIFFFVSTSMKILRHNKNGSGTRHAHDAQFNLHLKLFVLMGIGWLTEVLQWSIKEPELFWFSLQLLNQLQGIAIFFILVCKKKIWISLKERYGKTLLGGKKKSGESICCCTYKSRNIDNVESSESFTAQNKRGTAFSDVTNSSQITQ